MPDQITKIWVYNTCVYKDDPFVLLAQRAGHEKEFWHVVCGGITKPADSRPPLPNECKGAAIQANEREAGLREMIGEELFRDRTRDSDWSDNHVAHVIVRHGVLSKLPEYEAHSFPTPNGIRGVTRLEWVNLKDLNVRSAPLDGVALAASRHVFYGELPLRSMVVRVLDKDIIPRMVNIYGPFLRLPNLASVTAQPERHPAP